MTLRTLRDAPPPAVRRRPVWTMRRVVLPVVALLVAGLTGTGWRWSAPGLQAECWTPPLTQGAPQAQLEWVDKVGADGHVSGHECIGWTSVAQVPWSGRSVPFGTDVPSLCYQDRILQANADFGSGAELTVVLLTSFRDDGAAGSPRPPQAQWRLPADQPCPVATDADPSTSPAETEELQGVLLAQRVPPEQLGSPTHLRVVIANSGNRSAHADRVAELLTGLRSSVRGPVVVIASGDSRSASRTALQRLTAAGLVVVAPTLTADGGGDGLAFVGGPTYHQLSPSNRQQATSAVDFLAARGVRELYVYREDDVGDDVDLYTRSLADDVGSLFDPAVGRVVWLRSAADVRRLAGSLCRNGTQPPGARQQRAIFYAERWDRFTRHSATGPDGAQSVPGFAEVLDDVCRDRDGPVPVLAGDSLSRFMNNDQRRAATRITWPVGWFRKGVQCSELIATTRSGADAARRAAAGALLTQLQGTLGACPVSGAPSPGTPVSAVQVGERVPLTWDAVLLGVTLSLNGDSAPTTVAGTVDTYLTRPGVESLRALVPLCVAQVQAGDRSSDRCNEVFGRPS